MGIKRTISPTEGFLKQESIAGDDVISISNVEINTIQSENNVIISSQGSITLNSIDEVVLNSPLKLVNKNKNELLNTSPSVGTIAFMTDNSLGNQAVFFDGLNWRKIIDRSIVN